MLTASAQLDRQYQEMRWRILSLAADLDRLQRLDGGEQLVATDPRVARLRACLNEVLSTEPGRAERVQMALSEKGSGVRG